jgi:acyl-CoA thioesterase-1
VTALLDPPLPARPSRLRRWLVLIVALAALVGALLAGGWQWHERAAASAWRSARCERFTDQEQARAAAVTGTGAPLLVIGDSWSSGYGLGTPASSWPARLPGRVYVDGFPGSGFSEHASSCTSVAYADRAPADLRRIHPDLVVVEGGLNDFDQTPAEITEGFDRLMRELRGHHVIVVGPASAPSRAAEVPRVDRTLAGLSAQAHVPYFSTTRLRLSYQPDQLHPDQAGAGAFGAAVAAFVAAHA